MRPAPNRPASVARRIASFLAELPGLLLVAFILALLLRTFLLQAFFIPSVSMVPTLEVGDRVLVNRLAFRIREPVRGEIVVFSEDNGGEVEQGNALTRAVQSVLSGLGLAPPPERDYIKRIIGLPGETIQIRDGTVLIDGRPLIESANGDGGYLSVQDGSDLPPTRIPPGEYFVMGDNRPQSSDSRSTLGTVPRENLVGRAFVLVWPVDRMTILSVPAYEMGERLSSCCRTPVLASRSP